MYIIQQRKSTERMKKKKTIQEMNHLPKQMTFLTSGNISLGFTLFLESNQFIHVICMQFFFYIFALSALNVYSMLFRIEHQEASKSYVYKIFSKYIGRFGEGDTILHWKVYSVLHRTDSWF